MISVRRGSYAVAVYDPERQDKRWVGTFPDFATAQAAERASQTRREEVCPACFAKFAPRGRQRYCSHECRGGGRAPMWSLAGKGEANCRVCGEPAKVLHHIVPKGRGGGDRLENGLPLCAKCHAGWHARTVTITQGKLTTAELAHAIERAGAAWVERAYPFPGGEPEREAVAVLREENQRLRAKIDDLTARLERASSAVATASKALSREQVA